MPQRYEPKDIHRILEEIQGQNDRSAMTVGASYVAHALETALQSRLREPGSSREREILFSDFGILGTFSQQIWTAYFMKLIGPKTRHDLDILRIIRNIAAHDMNAVSFNDEAIASRLSTLTLLTRLQKDAISPDTNRLKFLTAVHLLFANLMLRSADAIGNIKDYVVYIDD